MFFFWGGADYLGFGVLRFFGRQICFFLADLFEGFFSGEWVLLGNLLFLGRFCGTFPFSAFFVFGCCWKGALVSK